ncbi:putative tricarboxylic transport membrane protein [Caldalkalibacillus uzonensis]|uniref:Tricarboxylic transport membrane protein n=1 Tax=Caldalkalibacillus uzonensis TaxID=353224 RepID=A0ABU0CNG7_9BACI|nr:tripartite tricarboxylate transporter permease [Caldalkalibacillus uzonensis]MDQ0337959.1 putative tricarboxylic transport membrane protein [Caldalkalibacillus uzonensis]
MIDSIIQGLLNSLSIGNLFVMSLAVVGGIIIGTLPGLSATMGVALLVPLTFGMDPATGLLALGALYTAAMFGGANSAILINTPGTPAAVATTFDGYPMTLKGEPDRALVTALVASVIGGIIGTLFLIFLSQPLATFALSFGPPENFWLAIFGLTIIGSLAGKSLLKGLIGGALGLLLALIGIDPVSGYPRFTFGIRNLIEGINLLPAMIGFFSIPQVIRLIIKDDKYITQYQPKKGIYKRTIVETLKKPVILLRSSLIGTFIGMLPGAGGNVASFVAYNETKRFSKEPQSFGKGNVDGVVTSESANNATVSSSLIPLLTLGIPGSPVAAVLLGGLLIHGLKPGAALFEEAGTIAYTFMLGLITANLLLLMIGLWGTRYFVRALTVPVHYLAPIIVVLAVIGSYSIRNSVLDVYVMLACGILGYFAFKVGISAGPIVLGLILGVIAEQGFVLSVIIADSVSGAFKLFLTRPISILLIILTILSIFAPIFVNRVQRKAQGEEGTRMGA